MFTDMNVSYAHFMDALCSDVIVVAAHPRYYRVSKISIPVAIFSVWFPSTCFNCGWEKVPVGSTLPQ